MKNKRLTIAILICIFLAGFLIKAYYVSYTETWMRQHDVISFGAEEGHAAYIEYLLNNKSLPDFDPREKWAFFQPPLHHAICALSMAASKTLGFSEKTIQENVQLLTLLYMCITMIVTYLMCKNLSIKNNSIILTMAIVSVHPMFTILSGSINNDSLSLMLALLSVYIAMVWYEKPTILNTCLLALCIGLSMMAKLTGALVAPGIGILMLMRIFREKNILKGIKEYWLKIILFIVIVAPLGLWWSIRNAIKWNMPINYIPPVGEQFPDEVGFVDRLFDMNINSPYVSLISNGDMYDEHNIFYALVKTSIFGEYNYSQYSRLLVVFAWILFAVSIVIALFALFSTMKVLEQIVKKSDAIENGNEADSLKINNVTNDDVAKYVMLSVTYIVYVAAYLSFALSYSNFSAQDFRYGAIAIIIQSIFLGKYMDINKSKWVYRVVSAFVAVFFVCSIVIYSVIGLRS